MSCRLPLLVLLPATLLAQPVLGWTVSTHAADLAQDRVEVDVYLPDGEVHGLAIVAHGFTRDRSRHRDLGRALAEAGVVAIVPDLPSVANHWGNGEALAGLVHDIERGTLGLPPVSRTRVLLIGTSAGGLATLIAASKLPGLGGWIGLDPVDRTGTGAKAAARLTAPAVVMLAEPSSCNLYGSGSAIAQAVPTLVRSETFPGASHCDFEAPTTKLCRAVCGKSPPGMDDVTRNATVTAAIELLVRTTSPSSPIASPETAPSSP